VGYFLSLGILILGNGWQEELVIEEITVYAISISIGISVLILSVALLLLTEVNQDQQQSSQTYNEH
jgi:hypothetical protein